MARPATGQVVTRKLANGDTRYSLRFRALGERVYETLGTDAEGWNAKRAQEALDDRLAEVRLGSYSAAAPWRRGRRRTRPCRRSTSSPPSGSPRSSPSCANRPLTRSAGGCPTCCCRTSSITGCRRSRLPRSTATGQRRSMSATSSRRHAQRGEKIDRRPLSNSTINRTIGLLAQILDVAVEYGHIPANPARGKRRKLKADRPQRAYLDSAAQIAALLDAAGELDRESRADRQHINRRAQLATLIFAGLRIGGVPGACGGATWTWPAAGSPCGKSKTDAGRRKVKIRPVLRDVLLAHKPLDASPTEPRVRHRAGQAAEPVQRPDPRDRQGGRAGQ